MCCYQIPAADIRVGYERSIYTTPEGDIFVELCAIIYEPDSGVTPRPFVLSYATDDYTAGKCKYFCSLQDILFWLFSSL